MTPEYPNGIYCYFATVDANHNSAYPYLIGPTYYGNKTGTKVTSISESTTIYNPVLSTSSKLFSELNINLFPNPASDLIAIQIGDINNQDIELKLMDIQGKLIQETKIFKGQTIGFFDVQKLYAGTYVIQFKALESTMMRKIIIEK